MKPIRCSRSLTDSATAATASPPPRGVATNPAAGTTPRDRFRRGFLAMLPLWAGAVPAGIAYAVAAHAVGFPVAATIAMSLTVFSAAAQVSVVTLRAHAAPVLVVISTALLLNLQWLLYGVTLERRLHAGLQRSLVACCLLTDAAYAVAMAAEPPSLADLFGAGTSMFIAWNAGTLLGAALDHTLPNSRQLGLDFIVPLTFVAVLVSLAHSRAALLVVLVAAATASLLSRFAPGGSVVLGSILTGCAAGACAERYPRRSASEPYGEMR